MSKLTDAQTRVLKTLLKADGRQMLLVGPDIIVSKNMLKYGFVLYFGHHYFAITDAGRAALAKEGE